MTKVVVGHSFDPLVIYGVEVGDVVRKLSNGKFTLRTGCGSGGIVGKRASWGGGSHGFKCSRWIK
jgi:hypothetical protein